MFYNMNFTDEELKFLFIESRRVLKNNGLLYFSVRSDKDAQYNILRLLKMGPNFEYYDIF
jgi:hypothetical protein